MIWSWLIANGLERDLLSAAVLVPIMRIAGAKPLRHLKKLADNAEIIAEVTKQEYDKIEITRKTHTETKVTK